MDIGQERKPGREKKQAVQEPHRRRKPPSVQPEAGEEQKIHESEQPTADHVEDKSDDDGPAPISSEESAGEKRKAQTGHTPALRALQDRGHPDRREQAPDHHTPE